MNIPANFQPNTSLQHQGCLYCGALMHTGLCPRIAEIEYHQDGSIKRVVLHPAQALDRGEKAK